MSTRRAVLAGAAALAAAGRAEAASAQLADLTRGTDAVLGVAVIARKTDGEAALAEAHGLGMLGEGAGRRQRPFALETPVRVASISKMVATAGLIGLMEQGRAASGADVSDLLGWRLRHPDHPERPITLARLASHTSGLRNGANYPVPLGRRIQDVLTPGSARFEADWFAPAGADRAHFAYADINFALLAQAMERASGERFDRYMSRTVLGPLGLDAGYNWSGVSQAKRELASACCRPVDDVWTPQVDAVVPPAPGVRAFVDPEQPGLTADDYRLGENGFAFAPQGGLRASVRDLDRLAQAFRDGRVPGLSRSGLQRMMTPAWRFDGRNGDTTRGYYQAYGLGVQVPTGSPEGDAFFGRGSGDWRGHFGEAYGLVSGCWWNVKDGRTLAYVINGTPKPAETARGARSAATPWEEAVIDTALDH